MIFNPQSQVESLYLHWPFCPYKCHFCPFVALASHDHFMGRYHDALKKEIQSFAQRHEKKMPLKTIFIGGGTPSTYPEDLLLDMFGTLYNEYSCVPHCEISLEVNPGTVTPEKVKRWKEVGINRLSVGVQSLDDRVLHALNRHQSAADVYRLFEWAAPEIENISVDLIIGLPGVTGERWKDIVKTVVTWPIKHVSLYILMVHEDTPLYFGVRAQRIALPADEEVIASYMWSVDYLKEHGFEQYEVSNFARPGYESVHNRAYWERKPYKGFGLGACSFDGIARFQNEKNLMQYFERMKTGDDLSMFSEQLTAEQAWLEELMLGVRQASGISLAHTMARLPERHKAAFEREVQAFQEAGLVVVSGDVMTLTPRGRALEQEIVARLAIFIER